MKKTSSILIIALLALSALMVFVPIAAHATITGTPVLADSNIDAAGSATITPASASVTVIAGTAGVTALDGSAVVQPAYFALATTGVTFSGANIYLYLSANGNAQINNAPSPGSCGGGMCPGDIFYAGPFPALQLSAATLSGFSASGTASTNGPYFIGQNAIVGPIPALVNASYQYVKLYDGSCGTPSNATSFGCTGTGIAGAKQLLNILPGISITPASGSAGDPVTIMGGGFGNGVHMNITYAYSFTSWEGITSIKNGTWSGFTGIVTGKTFSSCPAPANSHSFYGPANIEGTFCLSGKALDTKQAFNERVGVNIYPTVNINASAWQPNVRDTTNGGILNLAQEDYYKQSLRPYFAENSRQFNFLQSGFQGSYTDSKGPQYYPSSTDVGNDSGQQAANDITYFSTSVSPYALNVFDSGDINVTGSNFYTGGALTVTLSGYGVIATFNGTSKPTTGGLFSIGFNVPNVPLGLHNITITSDGVPYVFAINIIPALILTPDSGSPSSPDTVVTVTGFGFPANAGVYIFWNEITTNDFNAYNVVNTTSDATGALASATFSVPDPTFGGIHYVYALDNITLSNLGETVPSVMGNIVNGYRTTSIYDAASDSTTYHTFLVTPTLCIDVGTSTSCVGASGSPTIQSVNANAQSSVTAYAEGLSPTTLYQVFVDSASHGYLSTFNNALGTNQFNGNAVINMTSAGFRPGLHQIEIDTSMQPTVPNPVNFGFYCREYYQSCFLQQASEGNFSTPATYGFFNVTTTGDYIYSGFASLTATMNSLSTTVSGLSTSISNMQTSISSIQTSIGTLTTDVGNLQTSVTNIGSQLTSLATSVSGAASSASSAATAANNAATAAQQAASNTSGLSNTSTYVLVVAVLAAITLVLELAILVRKLS
ncbi:MAG: hypothetical protein JRN57_00915 [Nitrososphaerota archaeon]|nr:hypothetical protein [Nitrososphaerota archaeon]